MSKKPTISVLMSVYNGEKYLATAIDSILSQTYQDFEFIIVNDASTDESEQIIKSYHDSRIIYRQNKTNLGLTKSLNLGLAQARGQYIARMDGDDLSLPERLAEQIRVMEQDENLAVCGGQAQLIDWQRKITGQTDYPTTDLVLKINLHFYNCFLHSAVLIRKKTLLQVNGYDESYKRAQDFNLWHRILLNGGKFLNLEKNVLQYRQHQDNISVKNFEQQCADANRSLIFLYQQLLGADFSAEINLLRRLLMTDNKKITWKENYNLHKFYQQIGIYLEQKYLEVGKKEFTSCYHSHLSLINAHNYPLIKLYNSFLFRYSKIS